MVRLLSAARSTAGISLAALAVAALAVGCTASGDEVRPPDNQLFFPTGLAVSTDQKWLFVANNNSDLRYDSATISVVDLSKVETDLAGWLTDNAEPEGCDRDASFSETLVCPASRFLKTDAGVRTGNFASTLVAQDLGDGNTRLIAPVRGDPSVTWIDWNTAEQKLQCADGAGFVLCDDDHRLAQLRNDANLPDLNTEPFGATASSTGEFALVSHLVGGAVTLVDSPRAGSPVLADAVEGIFVGDNAGLGAVALATHPTAPGPTVYVAGQSQGLMVMFAVDRRAGEPRPRLVPTDAFVLDGVGNGSVGISNDTRGLAFDASGDRMFLANRLPPSLQVWDTSLNATGVPANRVIGATDMCTQSSGLVVGDTDDGTRAFVTCFGEGELWIVDPRGRIDVEAFVQVGRGAYGAAYVHPVDPANPTETGRPQWLFVSNFLDDTIAVVDVNPASRYRNRVVLRIGESRQ